MAIKIYFVVSSSRPVESWPKKITGPPKFIYRANFKKI